MSGFSATLMEHFSDPRHRGRIEAPHSVGRASRSGQAPFVTFYLRCDGDRIGQVSYETFGCGVSIACCSALSELVSGRTLAEASAVTADSLTMALDGIPAHKDYCAQLAVDALRDALGRLKVPP